MNKGKSNKIPREQARTQAQAHTRTQGAAVRSGRVRAVKPSRAHVRSSAAPVMQLNVLIACEESQAECLAFRALGHNAYSCDIQPARYRPDWHILDDCRPYLRGETKFVTQDGVSRNVSGWDLIISHPPCTYLCKVSSVHMVQNGIINEERYQLMRQARSFFFECLNANCSYVAVENPLPMGRAELPPPSCFIQPSWFGVKYTKKTLYWLKNLPPIMPEIEYPDPKEFVRASRGKYRSRTFPEVAQAIALQWSEYIIQEELRLRDIAASGRGAFGR